MYWLILLRPNSPSRLSAWSDGHDARHQLHDDRGVDVRVHPQRHDREVRQAAAREQVEQRRPASCPGRSSAAAPCRRPGSARDASRRKTISSPRTYRIRRRMSGARKALRSDSNTGQASSPDGVSASDAGVGCVGVGASSVALASARTPRPSALAVGRRRLGGRRPALGRPSARRRLGRRPSALPRGAGFASASVAAFGVGAVGRSPRPAARSARRRLRRPASPRRRGAAVSAVGGHAERGQRRASGPRGR